MESDDGTIKREVTHAKGESAGRLGEAQLLGGRVLLALQQPLAVGVEGLLAVLRKVLKSVATREH